jgi:hypothetical protein
MVEPPTIEDVTKAAFNADFEYTMAHPDKIRSGYEWEIPRECWNDVIKSLKIVRVYNAGTNIVIAINARDNIKEGSFIRIEEGIFIRSALSNMAMPRNGRLREGGFLYVEPAPGSMINYRRYFEK